MIDVSHKSTEGYSSEDRATIPFNVELQRPVDPEISRRQSPTRRVSKIHTRNDQFFWYTTDDRTGNSTLKVGGENET